MTDDCTPTTDQVRLAFAMHESLAPVRRGTSQMGEKLGAHFDSFDRWLAAHDAEKRAEWDAEQGWEYGISYTRGNEEFEGQDLPTIQRRVKYIRRQGGYYSTTVHAVRRRPAGDPAPVEREGEPA